MSAIEWTNETWNPIAGCSRKSAGCQNCYAETMTKRLAAMGQAKYAGLLNDQDRFNGVVRLAEAALTIPLKRNKPTTYFVTSMSDLFQENVPDEWIDKIFAVMALCPQHTFQVLTKRADRMQRYFEVAEQPPAGTLNRAFWRRWYIWAAMGRFGENSYRFIWRHPGELSGVWPLPNVWLGVSVENQKAADERIPHLLETPAAIRFLSCEPLLESITIHNFLYTRFQMSGLHHDRNAIDWVIVGGESGAKARPCHVGWIRSVVAQCKDAGTPVFVKQLGSLCVTEHPMEPSAIRARTADRKGGDPSEWPEDLRVREMPK